LSSFENSNPASHDFLSQLDFRLIVKRIPNVSFFCQQVNLPGLTLDPIEIPNPLGQIWQSSNKLLFNELSVTFKINQDFSNWFEIFNWLTALGHPYDLDQYTALAKQPQWTGEGLESDMTVMVLDGSKNSIFEIVYSDCRPISLGDLVFTSADPDVKFLTSTAKFRYTGQYQMTDLNKPVEVVPATNVDI
jgi:hypothetical protein